MKTGNALVAKEIRLLLPAYVAALVLAILPVWLLPNLPYRSFTTGPAFLVFCAFGFGIVMLALSSFGREFGMNTFPLMLAATLLPASPCLVDQTLDPRLRDHQHLLRMGLLVERKRCGC